MPDIFISYSRKDSEHATMLAELLRSAGISCWIDTVGIEAASSWSAQIVDAINDCKVFVALLSSNSVTSHNVIKEVSLASEKQKKIFPLDLEPVALPRELEYPLAGIQRTSMTDIDAVIRALGKLGLEATGARQAPKIAKQPDGRKSLMILPFEDLSPTGDNGWFADGIASELISALSNVKSLRLADSQATKEFKRYHGQLSTYAREMEIRYFVQGDVRKFGDQIKIGVRLLDIATGDHLWQHSLKGTMAEVFEIQEQVAEKVVDGLKLHLTLDEKHKLAEHGTENAEAYELLLKAHEYFDRQTKDGIQHAAQLFSEAIALDPGYAQAYAGKVYALTALYRSYDRDRRLLDQGLSLLKEARRLKPDLPSVGFALSVVLMLQSKLDEAEQAAEDCIRSAPQDYLSHFSLGFFYMSTGQHAKAIAPFEEVMKLNPDSLVALWNLAVACDDAREDIKLKHWALFAIPKFEKHLKLFPDDETKRVWHAVLLQLAGRYDDARAAVLKLNDLRDGLALSIKASLHCALKEYSSALTTFRKAIRAGFRNTQSLKSFLEEEVDGIGSLKGTPEYEEVKRMVETIVAEEEAKKENA